ncbi:MAG: Maf family protein [Kiritimatiellia bacterium]
MPLTLASQSPRRAKILADFGVDFVVLKTDALEVSIPAEPERTVVENAVRKLRACGCVPALAADTIVWLDGVIYGKPVDMDEARRFLRGFSGRTHSVFTGVAYADGSGVRTACCRSDVTFRELSDADIDRYVARVHPTDRAGAYDIDDCGEWLVASYMGSYENIMGLPVDPLREWSIVRAPLSV